jgi:hypothetical protein
MTTNATLSLLIERPNGFKSYELGRAQLVWRGKQVTYMLLDCEIQEEIRLFRTEKSAQTFVNRFGAYLRTRYEEGALPSMIEFLAYSCAGKAQPRKTKVKGAKKQ